MMSARIILFTSGSSSHAAIMRKSLSTTTATSTSTTTTAASKFGRQRWMVTSNKNYSFGSSIVSPVSMSLLNSTSYINSKNECGNSSIYINNSRHPSSKVMMMSTTTTTTTTTAPSSTARMPMDGTAKVVAPPMVYIAGEEMTRYACELVLEQWIRPYFDTKLWEYFDLSCINRDATNDQVLHDAVKAGARIGAIFKEPTITPSAIQCKEMGLKNALGSPNGAMRRGWNGITISRDTIHIDGIELGYKNPVLFERHAVGGEYGAGWKSVGAGTLLTNYIPNDPKLPTCVVDKRDLSDDHNVVVVYHNPYDNVAPLAHFFFQRCYDMKVTPYIVTKKTVFKWQEGFWQVMKEIFDHEYKDKFIEAGLLTKCNNELTHLISDAATMQLIRWTDGGFGMAAHNYDGDMLTDQIAQVHRSPGFITSNLVGKSDDGRLIKEFEASHGTVSDLWHDHLAGKETSLNPLGLVEAMIGALQHAAVLDAEKNPSDTTKAVAKEQIFNFCTTLRTALHNTFRYGQGTRDMSGPSGFTTEDFVRKVAWRLQRYLQMQYDETPPPSLLEPDRKFRRNYDIDEDAVKQMFQKYDKNGDGHIDIEEFTRMLTKMNLAPRKTKN